MCHAKVTYFPDDAPRFRDAIKHWGLDDVFSPQGKRIYNQSHTDDQVYLFADAESSISTI